jgi:hypothetical protein
MISELSMDISAYWDGRELNLACSLDSLRQLIGILRRNDVGNYQLRTEVDASNGANISTLEFEPRASKLVLAISDRRAIFSGNLPSFYLLADNLEFLCGQWSKKNDQHLHLEPSSNQFLFSPESEAIIVSKRN